MGDSEKRERVSATLLITMTVLLAGAAVSFFVYYFHRSEELPSQGLDVAEAPAPDPEPAAPAPATNGGTFGLAPAHPAGNLMPIKGAAGMATGSVDPKARAQQSLAAAVRPHERVFAELTNRYLAKYPIFNQWGKEWMTYPDLNKACKDYWTYHDPIRYVFQIAGSKNFAGMVGRYSTHPEMQAFLKDAVTVAPKDVIKAAVDYLQKDGTAVNLLQRFSAAAGLPPSLLAGFTGQKVDQKAVMDQILQTNPALQGGNFPDQAARTR